MSVSARIVYSGGPAPQNDVYKNDVPERLIHDTKRRNQTISCKSGNYPVEYPSWVFRCDIKGSDCTTLNPIFWKNVQGQKHRGRWEIAGRKISSVKMLFKTNTNGHKHPSIRARHDWWNQRKQQVAFNTGTAHSQKADCDGMQLHQYWTTLPVYKYILTQNIWTGTKVIKRKHIVQPIGFGAYSSTSYMMERMCQLHGSNQTPTFLFESKTHESINS